jgi:hypothetical protein
MKTGYDAAYPPVNPPATDVVLFYAPDGDQLNAWTLAEINAQSARYRLPIYVRSNPAQSDPTVDALNFKNWLIMIGCPAGSSVVLDLETAVDATYVDTFGWLMAESGYRTLPYGSSSTLLRNPELDGYFMAKPGAAVIPTGCVAVQYGGTSAYDLDLIADTVALWDTWHIPTKEDESMSIAIACDGTRVIERVSPAGHELVFTLAPGATAWSVTDVTAQIAAAFPQDPPFVVQP